MTLFSFIPKSFGKSVGMLLGSKEWKASITGKSSVNMPLLFQRLITRSKKQTHDKVLNMHS